MMEQEGMKSACDCRQQQHRTGVGRTRHIQVRWLWIQEAICDKVVRLRIVKGRPPRTKPTWGPKTSMDGDEEEFLNLSAQVMIEVSVAFVTWVMLDALRLMRQINTTALAKTVERGTQSEFNAVDQITIPTNVYCSPEGERYHTSRMCEGLQNVPMDAIRRKTFLFVWYNKDEHERGTGSTEVKVDWPVPLSWTPKVFEHMRQAEQCCGCPRRPPTFYCSRAVAGCSDEVSGRLTRTIAGGNDEVGRIRR